MKQHRSVFLLVSILLVSVPALALSCRIYVTPAHSVEVQNNSDKPVVIFAKLFTHGEWGDMRNRGQVAPGARRAVFSMVEANSKDDVYSVEARDLDGNPVKSWEFPYQDRILLIIDNTDVPK